MLDPAAAEQQVVAVESHALAGCDGALRRLELDDHTAVVLRLAQRATQAGCDGVVASAREASSIKRRFGRRLQVVCPGIRPSGTARGDHMRTATPCAAIEAGADWLVIGRPITESSHPVRVAQDVIDELTGASCH